MVFQIKLKIIRFLLKINVIIGRRLAKYLAKCSRNVQPGQLYRNQNPGYYQGMKNKMKAMMLKDQDLIDKRWDECQKCEFLTENERLGKTYNKCEKCGCFMKIGDNFIKIKVATAACPIGKWGAEYNLTNGQHIKKPEPIKQLEKAIE